MRKKIIYPILLSGTLLFGTASFALASDNNSFDITSKGQAINEFLLGSDSEIERGNLSSLYDELDENHHEYLVHVISLNVEEPSHHSHGLSKEEINEMAFNKQLERLALKDKAESLGVMPSDEQVQERIKEDRYSIEEGETPDGMEVRNHEETQERLKSIIKDIGISEEEYWSDYVPELLAVSLAEENVRAEKNIDEKVENKLTSEEPDAKVMNKKREAWEEKRQQIIQDFKEKNSSSISEFKNNISNFY